MRILIFFFLFSFIIQPAFTQVPTKQEMQNQMAQVVKELNEQIADLEKQIAEAKKNKEDDSVIKELQDQMALLKKQVEMMGGLKKNLSGISEKTIKNIEADDNNTELPKRDVARIKQLPDKILSDAELVPYVQKIHAQVENILTQKDKAEAQKIYAALKAEKKSSNEINNTVSSLWLSGYTEIALYIMGKECVANMKDVNILNNYAAFLAMKGGEHAALPILQNLHKKYPANSTILNNISQSWYGLGDMNNANRYLDSTVKIYKNHSQANQTKSKIEKSEGKTQESIESLKRSIKENYTPEKEARLTELGGKLEYDDIVFRYPAKAEPLGIEKFMFIIPSYPFVAGVESKKARMEWDDFKEKVWAAVKKIEDDRRVIEKKVENYSNRLLTNPLLLKPYNNTVYLTSARKLKLLYDWYTDRFLALEKKRQAASDSVKKWKDELNKVILALGDDPQNPNANCGKIQSLSTSFLTKANTLWQQRNAELLSLNKQKLNAEATYSLYGTHDQSLYELQIVNIKLSFLLFLGNLACEFSSGCTTTTAQKPPGKFLPDFDSLNCQYKEEYNIPPFTNIKIECNKMTTVFDIDTELGLKVKLGWEENLNSGKITKGTIEMTAEAGTDVAKFGPVGAELKGSGSVGVEITSEGVQEVYIKGASTIDVSGNINGGEITPGVQSDPKGISAMSAEVKISWNVGAGPAQGTMNSSLSGGGMLNAVNLSLR
ncbi:MAG: hypothetical protein JST17_01965 [Bacteroidetes bacterium]|nr:hypothetical protein [Bacteroidota bacterium]MBS1931407.1 hypothetical protein [Bacteroidota bacterium]